MFLDAVQGALVPNRGGDDPLDPSTPSRPTLTSPKPAK